MHIDGACHCGKVTYEAEVDPGRVSICHCTACQALSGSPWRASVLVEAADFRMTGDEPRIYIKIADSGARRRQAFCPDCGSPIYSCSDQEPKSYNLRLGAIRQRAQLAPVRQGWTQSALPWASDITALPATPRGA